MRWFSRRATLLGVLAFALVWGGAVLLAARTGDLTEAVVQISREPFPPGTIVPARTEEESCGDIAVPGLVTQASELYPAELDCFRDAATEGQRVVLVIRGESRQEDPQRVQLRVFGRTRIELVVDNTRDRQGDGTVTRYICTGLDPATYRPTDCEPAELPEIEPDESSD